MKNKNVSFRDVFCFPRKKCEQFDFLLICKLVDSGSEVFDSVFVAFCCCHYFPPSVERNPLIGTIIPHERLFVNTANKEI